MKLAPYIADAADPPPIRYAVGWLIRQPLTEDDMFADSGRSWRCHPDYLGRPQLADHCLRAFDLYKFGLSSLSDVPRKASCMGEAEREAARLILRDLMAPEYAEKFEEGLGNSLDNGAVERLILQGKSHLYLAQEIALLNNYITDLCTTVEAESGLSVTPATVQSHQKQLTRFSAPEVANPLQCAATELLAAHAALRERTVRLVDSLNHAVGKDVFGSLNVVRPSEWKGRA